MIDLLSTLTSPSSSSELSVVAMLDERKLTARALFDDSNQRQTQLGVRVYTGETVCHNLPFHVFVSMTHTPELSW